MTRLLEYAREATAGDRRPVATFGDLGQRMGKSSAVLTNWKARGISRQGAIEAEALFGCSVTWVLTGEGARDSSQREPRAISPSPEPRAREVSESDWALLQDVKMLGAGDLREVREKARLIREAVDRVLAERLAAPAAQVLPMSVPPAPPQMGDRRKLAPFVMQPGEPYDPLRMGDRRKAAPFVLGNGVAPSRKQTAKKGGR